MQPGPLDAFGHLVELGQELHTEREHAYRSPAMWGSYEGGDGDADLPPYTADDDQAPAG